MDKRVFYERPGGEISFLVPAPNERREGESDQAFAERIALKDVPVELVAPVTGVDGVPLPAGTLVPRIDAEQNGWAYTELPTVIGDAVAVPADRTFRNAWCWPNVADLDRVPLTPFVSIHMPRARALELARLRAVRDAVLLSLDPPQQRALVAGDTAEVQRIENVKQQLRDLPATVNYEAAATPAAILAKWPAALLGPRAP